MITRRRIAVGAAAWASAPRAMRGEDRPIVLMTSFRGCTPCRLWRAQVLPRWRETAQFSRLVFHEIETAGWRELEDPQTWPEEFRWVRAEFEKDWRIWSAKDQALAHRAHQTVGDALVASPRFFVGRGGALLESAPGKGGWQRYIQPLLGRLLGDA